MKKTIIATILFVLAFAGLSAQNPTIIRLWPDGAPNDNGARGPEVELENGRVTNISDPTITVYPAKNPNGLAIIACPGGGYVRLAMNHEGYDMADWYNSQGITYAVLKYRMPNGNYEVPLSDVHQAIRILRQHSEDWGIKKVGVQGNSAGGNLACLAANRYDAATRPDFHILFYAFTGNRGSRQGAEKDPTYILDEITPDTPPAFILHSSDDHTVPVMNSINYFSKLIENKVSATMHIYPSGGHGWGYNDSFPYKRQWTGELEKWLRDMAGAK